MAYGRMHEIHFPGPAAVELECCDLFRVRRPQQHRIVASGPTSIVGGVTEILNTVLRKLYVLPPCEVANPKVVITDESCAFAVRRQNAVGRRSLALVLNAFSA